MTSPVNPPVAAGADAPLVEARPELAAVFREESAGLVRYAFGLLGRRAVAEEVVQEAFLRLHRQWDEVRQPRPWLYRCVRNLSLNEMRDHKREMPESEYPVADPDAEAPDEELGRHEAIGMLRLLLAELESDDARLVEMKYLSHQSYAQIAEATGMAIGTVGYKLHHILKDLAASLRRAGIESPLG